MNHASMGKRKLGMVVAAVLLFSQAGVSLAGFIVPTWTGPFSDAEKKCLEAAIANWLAHIDSVNTLAIEFKCDNDLKTASGGVINGTTSITDFYDDHQGQPKAAVVTVNNNALWWDPTPETSGDIPGDKRDGISTAMHEICHALGFTFTLNPTGGFAGHITDLAGDDPDRGLVWTDGTLTVDMDDNHMTHIVDAGLMYYAGAEGLRNVIEDRFITMLTQSHDCYSPIPEPVTMLGVFLGFGALGGYILKRR